MTTKRRRAAQIRQEELVPNLLKWMAGLIPNLLDVATGRLQEKGEATNGDKKPRRGEPPGEDVANSQWILVVPPSPSRRRRLLEGVAPLQECRKREFRVAVINYECKDATEYFEWTQDNLANSGRREQTEPHILLLGTPAEIPFSFQSFLDGAASVGRLDFSYYREKEVDALRGYCQKIARLESTYPAAPLPDDAPYPDDPRRPPLIMFAPKLYERGSAGWEITICKEILQGALDQLRDRQYVWKLWGHAASPGNLVSLLGKETRPALVLTATHGIVGGLPGYKVKEVLGALDCPGDQVFSSRDVPQGSPFAEGAVWFNFGCYGYGWSRKSMADPWWPRIYDGNHNDFVASLPQALLAHPQGPVAFVGHVDETYEEGVKRLGSSDAVAGIAGNQRQLPFIWAILRMLEGERIGTAMTPISHRSSSLALSILQTLQDIHHGEKWVKADPGLLDRLTEIVIMRADAAMYMVFGDPAVRLPRQLKITDTSFARRPRTAQVAIRDP